MPRSSMHWVKSAANLVHNQGFQRIDLKTFRPSQGFRRNAIADTGVIKFDPPQSRGAAHRVLPAGTRVETHEPLAARRP